MLPSRQCRLYDAARRQCCHRDNADHVSMPSLRCCQCDNADLASMPSLRCCLEAMLSSRQCRFHDAVRRPCCHRDNADLASMPFLRCCLEAMLTTVNADTDRRGIAATNGLTFACPLFFIVALQVTPCDIISIKTSNAHITRPRNDID